jgi:hypothetical protein
MDLVAAYRVRAGYMGTSATPRVIAPTVRRVIERNEENLGDFVER